MFELKSVVKLTKHQCTQSNINSLNVYAQRLYHSLGIIESVCDKPKYSCSQINEHFHEVSAEVSPIITLSTGEIFLLWNFQSFHLFLLSFLLCFPLPLISKIVLNFMMLKSIGNSSNYRQKANKTLKQLAFILSLFIAVTKIVMCM